MDPYDSPAERLRRLGRRQGGVVNRAQLRAIGFSDEQIKVMVRRRQLIRMHQGVYALGHLPTGRRSWFVAGLLAVPRAALSHDSAAELWGFATAPDAQRVHLTTGDRSRTPTRGLAVHRVRSLDALDVTEHRGLRVTTPARTLLDRADQLGAGQLESEASKAKLLGLVDERSVAAVLARSPGRRTRKLARCAGLVTPTRSTFERRLLHALRANSLPLPQTNVVICGWEVDAYWPECRYAIELDSWAFHNDKRTFRNDRTKHRALQREGIHLDRFTWDDLADGTLIRDAAPKLSRWAA